MREEMRARAHRLICGKFETWTSHGAAVWREIVSAENEEEAVEILEYVLVNFGLFEANVEDVSDLPAIEISDDFYNRVSRGLLQDVDTLLAGLVRMNPSSTKFATEILAFLRKQDGDNECAIAVALILQSHYLPYVVYPENIFEGIALSSDWKERSVSARRAIALIFKLNSDSSLTAPMRIAAAQKIIAELPDPKEGQFVVATLITVIYANSELAARIGRPTGILLSADDFEAMFGAVPDIIGRILPRGGARGKGGAGGAVN